MRFNKNGVIGEIDNLPGCSQIAVFHSVFVPTELRGRGLGDAAHNDRMMIARELGYNLALCTAQLDNIPQQRILQKHEWTQVTRFVSHKTGHLVGLYLKGI